MGIYIKGMEMPEHCDECYLREKNICPLTKTNVTGWGIPLNCPLVPVPPHGRLIDADTVQEEFKKFHDGKRLMLIDTAPTIIPADQEEEATNV